MNARDTYSKLAADLPKLHCWEGVFSHGGFDKWLLDNLFEFLESTDLASGGKTFLETGAGNSTLLFLSLSPEKVVTCTLEDDKFVQRLHTAARSIGAPTDPLDLHIGRSEVLLPALVLNHEPFVDFALIDGGHGWPTVFVDFCYAAYATRQNGYIVLDDTQLYSVAQLFAFLKEQPGWEISLDLGKTVIFRKLYADRFLPDFGGQPFIQSRS